jgi:hypothetical protein
MARQFREQLEEEVQLEQARKANQTAPAPDSNTSAHEPATSAAPPAAATGNGATGADPAATRPAQAGGADERRT